LAIEAFVEVEKSFLTWEGYPKEVSDLFLLLSIKLESTGPRRRGKIPRSIGMVSSSTTAVATKTTMMTTTASVMPWTLSDQLIMAVSLISLR
jgi:hypothetical protein